MLIWILGKLICIALGAVAGGVMTTFALRNGCVARDQRIRQLERSLSHWMSSASSLAGKVHELNRQVEELQLFASQESVTNQLENLVRWTRYLREYPSPSGLAELEHVKRLFDGVCRRAHRLGREAPRDWTAYVESGEPDLTPQPAEQVEPEPPPTETARIM